MGVHVCLVDKWNVSIVLMIIRSARCANWGMDLVAILVSVWPVPLAVGTVLLMYWHVWHVILDMHIIQIYWGLAADYAMAIQHAWVVRATHTYANNVQLDMASVGLGRVPPVMIHTVFNVHPTIWYAQPADHPMEWMTLLILARPPVWAVILLVSHACRLDIPSVRHVHLAGTIRIWVVCYVSQDVQYVSMVLLANNVLVITIWLPLTLASNVRSTVSHAYLTHP